MAQKLGQAELVPTAPVAVTLAEGAEEVVGCATLPLGVALSKAVPVALTDADDDTESLRRDERVLRALSGELTVEVLLGDKVGMEASAEVVVLGGKLK